MASRNNSMLQIRIPEELAAQLAKFCENHNITMSEYVRRLIERAVGYEVK